MNSILTYGPELRTILKKLQATGVETNHSLIGTDKDCNMTVLIVIGIRPDKAQLYSIHYLNKNGGYRKENGVYCNKYEDLLNTLDMILEVNDCHFLTNVI